MSELRVKGSGVGSGVPVEQTLWQAVRVCAGKAVFLGWFRTEAEALEAVRLRE